MADIYPRKGVLLLSEAKSILSNDPKFASLTDAQQNLFVNNAIQEVVNLRNSEGKEDFNADNAGDPNLLISQISKVFVVTTVERTALGLTLGASDTGYVVYDSDHQTMYAWSGSAWV